MYFCTRTDGTLDEQKSYQFCYILVAGLSPRLSPIIEDILDIAVIDDNNL